MSSIRAVEKKRGRPKSEASMFDISQPYNFKHDLHVQHDDVDAKSIAGIRSFPSEVSIPEETQSETLSRLFKDEILPTLHIEIDDIIEKKLQKVLDQILPAIKEGNRHCPRCRCRQSDQIRYSALETHSVEAYVNLSTGNQAVDNTYETDPNKHRAATQKQNITSDNDTGKHQLSTGRPVSNCMYPISGGDTLNQIRQRSNTMPISRLNQRPSIGRDKVRDLRGVPGGKADERECLANALQENVVELVNDVIFKDSELPDSLLADGCLTENESTRCRQSPDPRDQVRLLLRIIKGRDLDVLKRFLKHIKLHNASVAQKIVETFEQNKKKGKKSKACALCKLTGRVDLKYIADILYKHFLLDDGLYNSIFDTQRSPGMQGEIWHKVITCLNVRCGENSAFVKKILTEALSHKNHYTQLAKEVQWMITNQNEISCRCKVNYSIIPSRESNSSATASSKYPASSTSEVCEEVVNDNVPDTDETDGEASTPVQKNLEQTVAANSQHTCHLGNSENMYQEVNGPAQKQYNEQTVRPKCEVNKTRARNNATTDGEVEHKVNHEPHEPVFTPHGVAQKKMIMLDLDLVPSDV